MTGLTKYNGRNGLSREFRDSFWTSFDNFFANFYNDSWLALEDWVPELSKSSYPRLNVTENDQILTIEASVPGLKQEDVDVEWLEGILTIRGKSVNKTNAKEKDEQGERILRRELHKSSFSRSLSLDEKLYDPNTLEAKLENGLLKLTVKKIVVDKPEPKKIEVK